MYKKNILFLFFYLITFLPFNISAQWEVQLDVENFTYLDRIHFVDSLYGWAIGGATIGTSSPYFYTADGGKSWYLYSDWVDIMGTDINFVNRDTGFIASANGIIYKTTNGGQSWDTIQTPAEQDVLRLFFVDENNGWATLDNQNHNYQLLKTTNSGQSWDTVKVFETNISSIESLFFINDSIGYCGGCYADIENQDSYTTISKTVNKGQDWDIIYEGKNQFFGIHEIFFINNSIGWAVGEMPSQKYGIIKTSNGGKTWQEDSLPELTYRLGPNRQASIIFSIDFINDTLGWLTCTDDQSSRNQHGYILITTDGGKTWEQQHLARENKIYDIVAMDNNNAWAVGGDFIYYTNNADTLIIPMLIEEQQLNLFTIYPNPTNGKFTVNMASYTSYSQIQITDIKGNIISTGSATQNSWSIDITTQPSGIYFITIKTDDSIQTKKIIKL